MTICIKYLLLLCLSVLAVSSSAQRARDIGITIGVLPTGAHNNITDVQGVLIGHITLIQGNDIRTGVTAILPHNDNMYQSKVPAAMYIGNGYGKLMGYSQVEELGNIETPIILTNTLSVPTAANALITYTLGLDGNENVRSVNAIVGETNDGRLNDIRGRHVKEKDVLHAINTAKSGTIAEGNVGAGTGTVAFGYKGGIGSASRLLPVSLGGYTVGVLVQSNFGGVLEINGVPVGTALNQFAFSKQITEKADGSCMIVVATNAPLDSRNLKRLAKRAIMGLAKTGGIASNGSGDYVIAFSTAKENFVSNRSANSTRKSIFLRNEKMSPLFLATIEATEEAIINSIIAANTMTGHNNRTVNELPKKELIKLMKKYRKHNK